MLSSFTRWGVAALLLVGALGTGCGLGGYNKSPIVTEGPELSLKDVTSGTEVQVHLVVKDEDGDELIYKWIQTPLEPAGEFSDVASREPSWVAPDVTGPTSFLLRVSIQDGEGGALLGSTTIQVHPRQ